MSGTNAINNHLVLIGGKSITGKSASLMYAKDPVGIMYLNCEAGKRLPFSSPIINTVISDPAEIYAKFDEAELDPTIHTIVIDSLTYMMAMFESKYVLPKAGTKEGMAAWGKYAQFFKVLLLDKVANSTKSVVFMAHTSDNYNEKELSVETLVKVKGSIMHEGVESYFNNVISTKKVTIDSLSKYENPLLNITEDDELLGYKHVFQTRLTKDTVNERIRGPIGMWSVKETFIDNNIQFVFDRLDAFYN